MPQGHRAGDGDRRAARIQVHHQSRPDPGGTGRRALDGARVLRSRDTDLMLGALAALGWTSSRVRPHDRHPDPAPLHGADVYCGLAGTVMRFLPPVAAFADGPVRFDADEQARSRPQSTILGALRVLGWTSMATRCRSRSTAPAAPPVAR